MQLKSRENRARLIAKRQGLLLRKSRARDPRADDYGLYVLVDDTRRGNRVQRGQAAALGFARGEGRTLAEIERYLDER